jgi:hypothetical protein
VRHPSEFRLLERLEARQRNGFSCTLPVGGEIFDVEPAPLLDEAASRLRQPTTKDLAGVDPDQCFVLGVDRMEVGGGL